MASEREAIYRPDCNRRRVGGFPNYVGATGFYLVTQGRDVIYAYICTYHTAREVVNDVIARNDNDRTSLTGEWSSMDFVVWYDARIMATVHQVFNDESGAFRVTLFDEEGNMPADHFEPLYGWPTHDEWVALGRPDPIVLTDEDMARNRARADSGKDIRSIPLEDIRNPFEDEDEDEDT